MIIKSESFKEYFLTNDPNNFALFDFLWVSLILLLENIFVRPQPEKLKIKISAIGHTIIQTGKPRAITAPIQVAVGILLHHHYQSKYLSDILHAIVAPTKTHQCLKENQL